MKKSKTIISLAVTSQYITAALAQSNRKQDAYEHGRHLTSDLLSCTCSIFTQPLTSDETRNSQTVNEGIVELVATCKELSYHVQIGPDCPGCS